MKMNINFRIIAKIVLILVVIGFLMPIGSAVVIKKTGLEVAQSMVKSDKNVLTGLLLYLTFISAIIGVVIGVLLLMKNKIRTDIDWLVILVCIVSGLIVCIVRSDQLGWFKNFTKLQNGAYMILAGWIAAFVFQLFSTMRRER